MTFYTYRLDFKWLCSDNIVQTVLPFVFMRAAEVCGFCRKPVALSEPAIEALNRTYHDGCFQCRSCHCPLAGKQYYNKAGIPLCTDCYQVKSTQPRLRLLDSAQATENPPWSVWHLQPLLSSRLLSAAKSNKRKVFKAKTNDKWQKLPTFLKYAFLFPSGQPGTLLGLWWCYYR